MAEDEIHPQINFSDGTYAIFKKIIPDISIKGKEEQTILYYEFILKPTPRTILKWSITQDSPDFIKSGKHAGWYRKRYLKEYCQCLDPSPDSAVWHLHCDWHGIPKDIFDGQMDLLTEKIKTKDTQILALKNMLNSIRLKFRKASKSSMMDIEKLAEDIQKITQKSTVVIQGGQEQGGGEERTETRYR